MLPRTAAPLLIALVWESAGGYGPVLWSWRGIGVLSVGGLPARGSRQPR